MILGSGVYPLPSQGDGLGEDHTTPSVRVSLPQSSYPNHPLTPDGVRTPPSLPSEDRVVPLLHDSRGLGLTCRRSGPARLPVREDVA